MASRRDAVAAGSVRHPLLAQYRRIRGLTLKLTETLEPEDVVVQTMPDVSPTKWHLAHVTWFFERFILREAIEGYRVFNEAYDYLFNSYYYTAGSMHPRPERGLLSRPTLGEVIRYRDHVDRAMERLIEERAGDRDFGFLVTLGLNHEQQHQELLLTDIKHVFSVNPLRPAVHPELAMPESPEAPALRFSERPGGIRLIGTNGDEGFCFDNETPRHQILVQPHALGSRLVTNREYAGFIADAGYTTPELWLSDGWAAVQAEGWDRPLYWSEDRQSEFTLGGERDIDPNAPVTHVSYYEADAYARWAGARLPSEAEWELAAQSVPVGGNLLDAGWWQPVSAALPTERGVVPAAPATGQPAGEGIGQLYGDVWEWVQSAYAPYPGFAPLAGSLGEYNGKFMLNQMVVRGGSCVTSADHVRSSYRSFFYPQQRWQFLGFRLAKNL